MPLPLKRMLSWAVTLGAILLLGIGLRQLPGSDGVMGELRWRLRGDDPRGIDRAFAVAYAQLQAEPGSLRAALQELLVQPQSIDRCRAVHLLAELLPHDRAELRPVLEAWAQAASPADKLRCLPHTLTVYVHANHEADPLRITTALRPLEEWEPALTAADYRWLLAATLLRDRDARDLINVILLGSRRDPRLAEWLEQIDGLAVAGRFTHIRPPPDGAAPLAALRVPLAVVVDALDDPDPKVRHASGRLLVMGGDQRGFPAFCAWLRASGPLPRGGAKPLVDQYGEEWRKRCEGSGAAGQPGARDGG